MRVTIEREECISCGACWAACPQFFEENPDDYWSQVVEEYRLDGELGKGEAPQGLDCVTEAADVCPVEIIHVG